MKKHILLLMAAATAAMPMRAQITAENFSGIFENIYPSNFGAPDSRGVRSYTSPLTGVTYSGNFSIEGNEFVFARNQHLVSTKYPTTVAWATVDGINSVAFYGKERAPYATWFHLLGNDTFVDDDHSRLAFSSGSGIYANSLYSTDFNNDTRVWALVAQADGARLKCFSVTATPQNFTRRSIVRSDDFSSLTTPREYAWPLTYDIGTGSDAIFTDEVLFTRPAGGGGTSLCAVTFTLQPSGPSAQIIDNAEADRELINQRLAMGWGSALDVMQTDSYYDASRIDVVIPSEGEMQVKVPCSGQWTVTLGISPEFACLYTLPAVNTFHITVTPTWKDFAINGVPTFSDNLFWVEQSADNGARYYANAIFGFGGWLYNLYYRTHPDDAFGTRTTGESGISYLAEATDSDFTLVNPNNGRGVELTRTVDFYMSKNGVQTPVRQFVYSNDSVSTDFTPEEAAESIYYTLSGLRVERPSAPGIYIRVAGAKSEMVKY